jgi:hypothetical protein
MSLILKSAFASLIAVILLVIIRAIYHYVPPEVEIAITVGLQVGALFTGLIIEGSILLILARSARRKSIFTSIFNHSDSEDNS